MPKGDAMESGRVGESHEGGTGSVLLLLHGLGGTWHIWKPVLPLLEARHRVLALTLPGHFGGPSLPADVEPSVDSLADALVEDLRRRGIERAHIAGNSLGGWLALELARRGHALSVTALSPAGGWCTDKDYRAVARPFRIVFALMALLIVLTALFLRFDFVRRALNKQAMRHGHRMSALECRGAMQSLGKTLILPRLLASMGRLGPIKPFAVADVPVRIAWGEHDLVIPFERYGKPVLEAVSGAESLTLNGVGHVPMYDDPELVAEVILETTSKAEAPAA